jgi:restriction endonuclease S subunit
LYICSTITEYYILKTTLTHIANIQTGIYALPVKSGKVVYLQARHFNENGILLDTVEPELELNNQTQKHLLNEGDVIFAAKGIKNFATRYESKNGYCVASSTFLVIRLKEEFRNIVNPDYLCWFLNHPKTQEWIKVAARGSSMASIPKAKLQELEITLPPIEKQQLIVHINALQYAESLLLNQIHLLKEKYTQHLLITAINK